MPIAEGTVAANVEMALGGRIVSLWARASAARPAGELPFLASLARLLTAASLMMFMCSACTRDDPPIEIAVPSVATARVNDGSNERAAPAHGKSILVDIPAFELAALQDGVPVFRSRVIVGRAGTPTPELISRLYAVRFNPAWSPTPAMIRNEGAHYMPPGPQNPLGRILFELDNDQLIYLHDTNDRSLFNRDDRALSHGCVRVEQARQLASWALDVPLTAVDEMISRGSTFSVRLPAPIPVLLSNAGLHQPDRHVLALDDKPPLPSKMLAEGSNVDGQAHGCPMQQAQRPAKSSS